MALADRVGYHVNVYWERAPDYRTSRTLDWLNDACETKLGKHDRKQDKVEYAALMSPTSIAFTPHDAGRSAAWNRLFTQASRARQRLGRRSHTERFPISLLLTRELKVPKAEEKPNGTGAEKAPRKVPPYLLIGTKKWPGRRAAVSKHEWADTHSVELTADRFQCILHIGTVDVDVRFATGFEAKALLDCLEQKSEQKQAEVESGP